MLLIIIILDWTKIFALFFYAVLYICYYDVQVLEEFYNIFGPELKAVTGDPKRIDDVLKRVDELVKPIEEVHVHTS